MGRGLTENDLLNKITFLSKILEYYANGSTYACKQGVAPIDSDRGEQARFALKQIKDIEKYNESLMEDYQKAMETIKDQMDDPVVTDENWERVLKVNNMMKNI